MEDRIPTKPNRYAVYDDNHNFIRYEYHERADEPTQAGDALNKANLLPDEVATALGLTGNPQVADALNKISTFGVSKQYFKSSGTFTAPYTGKYFVELCGSGGDGGLHGAKGGASGGAGAGYAAKTVALIKGQTVPVTVGLRRRSNSGQASSFGSYLSATGGGKGSESSSGSVGNGVGGDINISGGKGSYKSSSDTELASGGACYLARVSAKGSPIGFGFGGIAREDGDTVPANAGNGVVIIHMLDKGE